MYTAENFYRSFQLNYFDYKQATSKYILGLTDAEINEFAGSMVDHDIEHYKRAIYMDIRQTYLLCIDTFFEVLYALLPEKLHKRNQSFALMDDKIVEQLNRKKPYIKEIEKHLKNKPNNFNKLDNIVEYSNGVNTYKCTVLQYIFYDGLFESKYDKEISESIPALVKAFNFLCHEVVDTREELNSYKHGLRILPFMNTFHLTNSTNDIKEVSLDMSNSVSFQTISKDKKTRTIHTKTFDFQRDIAMTNYISFLLHNIIALRRRRYIKKDNNTETAAFVFGPEGLENSKKTNQNHFKVKLDLPNDQFFDPQ